MLKTYLDYTLNGYDFLKNTQIKMRVFGECVDNELGEILAKLEVEAGIELLEDEQE